MEQFLKNFFNDNSVCVGLRDLDRKVAGIKFATSQTLSQQKIQPQEKQPRQSLAQYFAAQQQAYAAQQAYASQKTTYVAQQRVKNPYIPPEVESYIQRTNSQPNFKQQVRQQQTKQVNEVQPQSAYKQPITIVNGNMKKVISPAVPARQF